MALPWIPSLSYSFPDRRDHEQPVALTRVYEVGNLRFRGSRALLNVVVLLGAHSPLTDLLDRQRVWCLAAADIYLSGHVNSTYIYLYCTYFGLDRPARSMGAVKVASVAICEGCCTGTRSLQPWLDWQTKYSSYGVLIAVEKASLSWSHNPIELTYTACLRLRHDSSFINVQPP